MGATEYEVEIEVEIEDGFVVVSREGVRLQYDPPRARRLAGRLAVGAEVARANARQRISAASQGLKPSSYGLPGHHRIDALEATVLAFEIFGAACQIEVSSVIDLTPINSNVRVRIAE